MVEEIFYFVFDVVFVATGELILCALTLGRRKPKWRFAKNRPVDEVVTWHVSALIGGSFWVLLALVVWALARR